MTNILERIRVLGTAGALLFILSCQRAPASQASSSGSGGRTDSAVAARVGDTEITLEQVDEKALQTNMSAYQALYDARKQALEELVAEALLDEEARSRGITREELVEREIDAKIVAVTNEEVEQFYNQNRPRLGEQTLEQIGAQIREYLQSRNDAAARQAYLSALRAGASVSVSLDPPRVPIRVAREERAKGDSDAKITIVEYSDFQ
jgi:hypothetical protein